MSCWMNPLLPLGFYLYFIRHLRPRKNQDPRFYIKITPGFEQVLVAAHHRIKIYLQFYSKVAHREKRGASPAILPNKDILAHVAPLFADISLRYPGIPFFVFIG